MNLALGTVQFGLAYGATNRSGQVQTGEIVKILQRAGEAGIQVLDTAAAYGESEAILGELLTPERCFRVITKTVPLRRESISKADVDLVHRGVEASLLALKVSRLDGLLVHHAEDLLVPGGEKLLEQLISLRSQGLVSQLGVSVYTPRQAELIGGGFPLI